MDKIDWERELRKEKYWDILRKIESLRQGGISWEILYNYNSIMYLWSAKDNEYEEYREIWKNLVDHIKEIEDGIIPTEQGKIIDEDAVNDFVVPTNSRSAWQCFKEQLREKGIYSVDEIANIERGTIRILNNLSLETEEPRKGMIVGYVQSGKTTSIEALITMAADYGFNLFIVLSGIIENLRKQNLNRLKKDIEFGRNGNIHWVFSPDLKNEAAYNLLNSDKRVVTVCLKNSKRLQDLKNWVFNNSKQGLKNTKILLIDDEADQASLNTKDVNSSERSKINELITGIINNKDVKAMNYIGYTATPYGNFLNEMATYPKDFIYTLPKSTKYIGAEEIFGKPDTEDQFLSDGLNIKRPILECNEFGLDEMKMIKEIEDGISKELPKSLKDAICWFIITASIFRIKGRIDPVSMLIHTNRKVDTHYKMYNAIKEWLEEQNIDGFIKRCEKVYNEEVITKEDFFKVMKDYPMEIQEIPKFESLINEIKCFLNERPKFLEIDNRAKIHYNKGLNMVVDNCTIDSYTNEYEYARLAYPKEEDGVEFSTAFIIIGGNTLARGLTIEGLTTTYFCRRTGQMDTLMQMGRWFGYRIGYELLPRIWLDNVNLERFQELARVEYELREDLKKYDFRLTPMDYGPIIQNSYLTKFVITSRNKMQTSIPATMNYSGAKAQTTLFDKDEEIQKKNIEICEKFLNSLGEYAKAYNGLSNIIKEDVPFEFIKNNLLLKFNFCKRSNFFNNIEAFCEWVDKIEDDRIKKWNIIVNNVKKDKNMLDDKYWNVSGNLLCKIERSKKKNYDNEDYFSIGSLRSTRDLVSDIKVEGGIKDKSEKEIIQIRESTKKPQLIIYRIDKDSKVFGDSKTREDLGVNVDLIGMYLFVPSDKNKNYKNYEQEVTIRLDANKIKEEEE